MLTKLVTWSREPVRLFASMEANSDSLPTQAYQLQLEWHNARDPHIITGEKYWAYLPGGKIVTGAAIVYPEFNLLWLEDFSTGGAEEMSGEDFEKQFTSLPRWKATRYAIMCGVNSRDDDNRPSYVAFLCDCQTGGQLLDEEGNPVEGREHEVAQLRRGVELLMRGELFVLW
jgi:hypothetical protein